MPIAKKLFFLGYIIIFLGLSQICGAMDRATDDCLTEQDFNFDDHIDAI